MTSACRSFCDGVLDGLYLGGADTATLAIKERHTAWRDINPNDPRASGLHIAAELTQPDA